MPDPDWMLRDAKPADDTQWRGLWDHYTQFYNADVPGEVTERTWQRILDPASPVFAIVAEREDTLLGFAVYVLHEGTWTSAPVCYLEDLFVASNARGAGVGKSLITELLNRARANGWQRLYWHTQAGNAAARRLYDQFGPADDFVRYRLFLT